MLLCTIENNKKWNNKKTTVMKRIITAIVAMLTIAVSANAMSYEQARREALFLTDKMAYELNLNDRQYDAAFEINLDYLMGVTSVDDVYGTYWTRRNLDLSYILMSWQWETFRAATYFYRPLYWSSGHWHFGVYARYPRRDYFYFSRPTVYVSYCGGHSWRSNGGRSHYYNHRHTYRHDNGNHNGMRDRWNRGEFGGNRKHSGNSSTRVTVNRDNNKGNFSTNRTSGTFRRDNSSNGNSFKVNGSRSAGSFNRSGSTSINRNNSGGAFNRNGSTSINRSNSGGSFNRSGSTSINRSSSGGSFNRSGGSSINRSNRSGNSQPNKSGGGFRDRR